MSWISAFLAAAVATFLLGEVAFRLGWVDRRDGQEHRKPRTTPVPLVGGAAVLVGVLVAYGLAAADQLYPLDYFAENIGLLAWPGLLAAFLLGLADDLLPTGLAPVVKLAGQLLVGTLVAAYPGEAFQGEGAMVCMALGLLAVVAMNAINLFDHADGPVGSLSGIATASAVAPSAGIFAAAFAGYLPFNTIFRRRAAWQGAGGAPPSDTSSRHTGTVPMAMLGDSGSHVAGVLLATTPGAWWFLAIPVVDMARVALKRWRQGTPIWRGDRQHIGHLLGGLGFGPVATAALVTVAVIPPMVGLLLFDGSAALAACLLVSGALYFATLVLVEGLEAPASATGAEVEPLEDDPLEPETAESVTRAGRERAGEIGSVPEDPSGPFASREGPLG